MRNLNNLFRAYGKQILREQGAEVDAERKVNSKDVMSILSKSILLPSALVALLKLTRCYIVKANHSADPKMRLDDEELIAEMFTLTLAGHETTSATLTFVLYELARHPEYQERMRQEIRDVRIKAAQRGEGGLAPEDLESLTLTNNAIKVRTHPESEIQPIA